MPWSFKWSGFPTKPLHIITPFPIVPHSPPISFS
jgi:hypothetical protein